MSSDLLPDCHERESKEEPKGSAELRDQGGERVEEDLFLDLGCLGRRPECQHRRVGKDFWGALYKLVFFVMTRLLALSHLYYLVTICIAQCPVNPFKLSELLFTFANCSILMTPLVLGKPAANP